MINAVCDDCKREMRDNDYIYCKRCYDLLYDANKDLDNRLDTLQGHYEYDTDDLKDTIDKLQKEIKKLKELNND